ncbi:unnamed protein product [Rotaria sp. Silwood2]|nr:unnamed protein product [Rotaria sp. Silwood2]CAF2495074.1 unnamed protein product [Rotaria sp. Silwood2]CAF2724697.1 unnamed protein product [Rotaria sp. Silwood2]CAF2877349.1 unnamed protein product [Rotaria sp. Silwood2]CAF4005266.1 unnamed protein product [Rotaria sp. Silwood2]
MATSVSTASSSSSSTNTPTNSSNLSSFIPCQHTFVATRVKQNQTYDESFSNNLQRSLVPRVCRLRTNNNSIAIYALVDPMDTNMIASDVCVNMLVEQLSQISFEDESYKKKISDSMQQIFYETENRLLQMTFDHAEEKATLTTSSDGTAEKCLPSLGEAQSGAFLFAATVTQSNVYIAYVGTIRAFLISNNNGDLCILNNRPQYYHTGSLHTIDNDDESLRLRNLNVNLAQVKNDGLDNNHSKFTRCIGKLSEKLLSSAASANDVNEARCSALVCEPRFDKFRISPQDFAFVMMTDKLYEMYLKTGISEHDIPTDFIDLLRESISAVNPAQDILIKIEERFQKTNNSVNEDITLQDMGLLIHFFHQPKNVSQPSPFSIKPNTMRRIVDGEVTVDEVKKFITKHNEIQQKRERNRNASRSNGHRRENQTHNGSIEPFVRFDIYENLLKDNEELCQADRSITDLLYQQSTSAMDEKLTEFLKEHPSLKCD